MEMKMQNKRKVWIKTENVMLVDETIKYELDWYQMSLSLI